MITRQQIIQLKGAIAKLGNARAALEWAGAGDPAEISSIKDDYAKAEARVAKLIDALTAEARP